MIPSFRSVLKDYQFTHIKAETIISECQLVETTKLIHLIEERNETMDQAKRMLAVYKDMMHRVERAQNVLQFAKKVSYIMNVNTLVEMTIDLVFHTISL
ncbi:unnamed protein product [Schistosoma mattheei]|uniref:Uncharacterized protein n=1 Tax=Schistosoma mattheei TaxID=31246 RepID=A0A3P8IFD9_9TREM|nr:unnamed protein product [Schistosoma mattheei]